MGRVDFTENKGLPCGDVDRCPGCLRTCKGKYFSFFFLLVFFSTISPQFKIISTTVVSHTFFQVPAKLCPLIFQLLSLTNYDPYIQELRSPYLSCLSIRIANTVTSVVFSEIPPFVVLKSLDSWEVFSDKLCTLLLLLPIYLVASNKLLLAVSYVGFSGILLDTDSRLSRPRTGLWEQYYPVINNKNAVRW